MFNDVIYKFDGHIFPADVIKAWHREEIDTVLEISLKWFDKFYEEKQRETLRSKYSDEKISFLIARWYKPNTNLIGLIEYPFDAAYSFFHEFEISEDINRRKQGIKQIEKSILRLNPNEIDYSHIFDGLPKELENYDCFDCNKNTTPTTVIDLRFFRLCSFNFTGAFISGVDFSGTDLSGSLFMGCHIEDCVLDGCSMIEANFSHSTLIDTSVKGVFAQETPFCNVKTGSKRKQEFSVDFTGSEIVFCDFLQRGKLHNIRFDNCRLQSNKFSGSNLYKSSFKNSECLRCKFVGSKLKRTRFSDSSIITDCNFNGVELKNADFDNSTVTKCTFANVQVITENNGDKTIESRPCDFSNVTYKGTTFRQLNVNNVDWTTNPELRDEIVHQQFVEQTRRSAEKSALGRFFFWLWGISTNRGREPIRLFKIGIAIILAFSLLYFGAEYLCYWKWSKEAFSIADTELRDYPYMFQYLYFSVVTFSTLGFGDVTPIHPITITLVVVEVLLGYLTLGGLITFLANWLGKK